IRSEVDESTDRMQAKIRNAQLLKIPYMLVVGDKEQEADAVAIRLRSGEDLKAKPLAEFVGMAQKAIESKE
ncbi:MAG TPA: His/Gly/Thr/Pro-type tRNA ligase C-terminal domain-containing protein, partial [Anaerolineae bacterium]|nr:His/Gly/Thr/Pro-type tRNA ligase C-terminal domain-containing protein [Anaerolineae bacterium]